MVWLESRLTLPELRFDGWQAICRRLALDRSASEWWRAPSRPHFPGQRKVPCCAATKSQNLPAETCLAMAAPLSTVTAAPIASRLLFFPCRRNAIELPSSFIALCSTANLRRGAVFQNDFQSPIVIEVGQCKRAAVVEKIQAAAARNIRETCHRDCFSRHTFLSRPFQVASERINSLIAFHPRS